MKQRVLTSVALFLAILFLPYWIYVPLAVLATLLIPFYWEAVALGFIIDVLYGSDTGLRAPTALIAVALVAVSLPLRERIRWRIS